MNSKTREAIKDALTALQALAQGTIHLIGVDQCTQIMEAAEKAKNALDNDETIP